MRLFRHDDHPKDFLNPHEHRRFGGVWFTIHIAEFIAAALIVVVIIAEVIRHVWH